ncbi:MAG TPA: FAD-dependent oxidoreductase [Desulfomonilia bacterium]
MGGKMIDRREFIKLGAASGAAIMLGGITACGTGSNSGSTSSESDGNNPSTPKVESKEFDVIIAGAGPGGCLAALKLARKGFSVGLFDAGSEDKVGRQIVLAVERDIFKTVGLDYPEGDMLAYENERERIFSPEGRECFQIDCKEYPMPVAIHLDRFTRSIFAQALKAGVEFYSGYKAVAPLCTAKRVCGARFETPDGTADVNARLVIDATGFSAALIRKLPAAFDMRFMESGSDIVSAANRFYSIDPETAAAAADRGIHGAEEGWNRLGRLGVYSTFFSCLSLRNGRAYVLTGCKKDFETPDISAKYAADSFMEEQGYYNEKISAAESMIRISNSLDAPVADGFMAIGEAACQTVTVHASGVASSLYAGHLAAGTAAKALDYGDMSVRALWPYAAAYQTTRGAAISGLEVTRQTIDRLNVEDVNILIESGIMHKENYIGGVLVKEPAITAASIPDRMNGFLKHPAYIPVLLKMGLTAQKVSKHYRKYPLRYDMQAFSEWRNEKDRLFSLI